MPNCVYSVGTVTAAFASVMVCTNGRVGRVPDGTETWQMRYWHGIHGVASPASTAALPGFCHSALNVERSAGSVEVTPAGSNVPMVALVTTSTDSIVDCCASGGTANAKVANCVTSRRPRCSCDSLVSAFSTTQ